MTECIFRHKSDDERVKCVLLLLPPTEITDRDTHNKGQHYHHEDRERLLMLLLHVEEEA